MYRIRVSFLRFVSSIFWHILNTFLCYNTTRLIQYLNESYSNVCWLFMGISNQLALDNDDHSFGSSLYNRGSDRYWWKLFLQKNKKVYSFNLNIVISYHLLFLLCPFNHSIQIQVSQFFQYHVKTFSVPLWTIGK